MREKSPTSWEMDTVEVIILFYVFKPIIKNGELKSQVKAL